jgi:hypothetical protein
VPNSSTQILPDRWPDPSASAWRFVARLSGAPGSIWHRDEQAVYVRPDRRLYYPARDDQVYVADGGAVFRVVGGPLAQGVPGLLSQAPTVDRVRPTRAQQSLKAGRP